MDARTTKRLLKECSTVLDEWDPIGECPAGEYVMYAPQVLNVLLRGGDEAALVSCLVGVLKQLGLGPDAAPSGARLILTWYANARGGAR